MRVSEAMSREVRIASPDQSIAEAAQIMAEIDAGSLPVGEEDRLVGMITDRDIAIRGVAKNCEPDTKVREAMTPEVRYCFEDEELDDVVDNMGENKVRRLPVIDESEKLVGIVSLGDLARESRGEAAQEALEGVSQPGGQHDQ